MKLENCAWVIKTWFSNKKPDKICYPAERHLALNIMESERWHIAIISDNPHKLFIPHTSNCSPEFVSCHNHILKWCRHKSLQFLQVGVLFLFISPVFNSGSNEGRNEENKRTWCRRKSLQFLQVGVLFLFISPVSNSGSNKGRNEENKRTRFTRLMKLDGEEVKTWDWAVFGVWPRLTDRTAAFYPHF